MRTIKTNKKNNKKKIKNEVVQENEISIKQVAIVSSVILVFFLSFYLLTAKIISNRKKETYDYKNATLKEDENNILINGLLKQKETTYYVLATLNEEDDLYRNYLSVLENGVYYINMENALNKNLISSETVIDQEDVRNIRISDTTLFVITDHQISEYYVGHNDVLNRLKELYKNNTEQVIVDAEVVEE